MDTTQIPGLNLIPEPWRSRILFAFGASLIAGRIIHAIRTQGGLKAILCSVWFGTNTPKTETPKQDPTLIETKTETGNTIGTK